MDNGERGRRLMAMAAECQQDMDAASGRKSWNAVVRRAQEVVELALKSVLSYLGVDFPKVHDPAAVFIATLSARGMALSAHEAEDVRNVSAALARKRGARVLLRADRRRVRGRGSGGRCASHPPDLRAACRRHRVGTPGTE